ncbi:MAG: efflux RND transporter permease subunit [Chitinophagales bacterium]|nr:efflux RND transporter permease subunit [Chitinophagales bacterium]
MRNLVHYFIRYSVSGNILLLLILVFGLMGLKSMQSTFFPEIPSRAINIQIVYPGAAPEEIEESVVLKIEDKLKGVTGLDRVTSVSNENAAVVNVEITQYADIDDVLQDVKNAVDQITSFPVGVESIDIFKQESIGIAISFVLSGSDDLAYLKKIAREIERDLLGFDGISKVTLGGFPDEEIVIELKESGMKSYGINFQQVVDKVAATNLDVTGGTVKGDLEELNIRLRNKGYYADDFANITIASSEDGRIVKLKDIAVIEDRWAESPNKTFYNGARSVTIDVYNTNDEDLLGITEFVNKYINDFNGSNEVQAYITNDSSIVVSQRIDMLINNGTIGFILVLILLAMFLNWRIAGWVALAIPVSFAGMFIIAPFFGVTINVISLFGMITVIGILVDDGVVISENIYQHFEKGKPRIQAAIDGTLEVLPAVTSAIITTIVVFSSFFFIEGRLGDFFSEMALIVIGTLLFSLIEGVLILPAHIAHSKALDPNTSPGWLQRHSERYMKWLREKVYEPSLSFALNNKALAFAIPFGLLVITFGALGGGVIKSTFFPFIERDQVNVSLLMPAGTPQEITNEKLEYLEEVIWKVNTEMRAEREDSMDVVLSIDKRLGPVNTFQGTLNIKLLDVELRDMSVLSITSAIREEAGPIVGAESVIYGAGSTFGKPISIALRGDDMNQLRQASDEMKFELEKLNDLKDVTDSDQEGLREVVIKLKDKSYLLGLTERDILSQVRQGYYGGEVQRVQRGLDEVKVWVRYDKEERSNLNNLRDMNIRTASGEAYPLSELVDMDMERGVIGIDHTDGQREITVEADVSNAKVSVSDMITNITGDILPRILQGYDGVTFSLEGQSRQQQKSIASMQRILPIVFLIMIAVIIFTFRSWIQTVLVISLIPFSFIGVAWGHYIHDLPISLFSVLGLIALIGIIVNDSLVFINAFNTNLKQGLSFDESLKTAALSRFRPILLTSVTTIAGLAPLMLNKSFQAQFLIPMAISVAYGLAVATLLVLVQLPILLSAMNNWRRFINWYWTDRKPAQEEVEPAIKEMEYE